MQQDYWGKTGNKIITYIPLLFFKRFCKLKMCYVLKQSVIIHKTSLIQKNQLQNDNAAMHLSL